MAIFNIHGTSTFVLLLNFYTVTSYGVSIESSRLSKKEITNISKCVLILQLNTCHACFAKEHSFSAQDHSVFKPFG